MRWGPLEPGLGWSKGSETAGLGPGSETLGVLVSAWASMLLSIKLTGLELGCRWWCWSPWNELGFGRTSVCWRVRKPGCGLGRDCYSWRDFVQSHLCCGPRLPFSGSRKRLPVLDHSWGYCKHRVTIWSIWLLQNIRHATTNHGNRGTAMLNFILGSSVLILTGL